MKRSSVNVLARASSISVVLALAGCGGSEVKLADVPPASIAPVKEAQATKSKQELKSGAPARGSSSGISHNPSETP